MIENPYMDEIKKLEEEFRGSSKIDRLFSSFRIRESLVTKYAWSVPDEDFGNAIAELKVPLIEIGAGTGYWAWYLTQFNIRVKCFDIAPYENLWAHQKHFEVFEGSYEKIKEFPNHALFLCWPPYNEPLAYNCLSTYTGKYFVSIGESQGGCTGDEQFFEYLHKNFDVLYSKYPYNFTGIHSVNEIYVRRKEV